MADEPRRKGFDLKNPGGKEILIVGAATLGVVLIIGFVRGKAQGGKQAAPAPQDQRVGFTTTVATPPEVLKLWIHDHMSSPGHRDAEHFSRQVATGTTSLDQVARERHSSPQHIIETTREAPEITRQNKARFNRYVAKGTHRRMPAGLVFYTTNQGSDYGSKNSGYQVYSNTAGHAAA